ncbi:MAG: InlB B-repeat-containing protein [Clostridiales bacterium]|nr:InlB B-repeat-containing protein [Clostridiales bacterium]
MKTKFSRILFVALILTLVLTVFAACNTGEQSLDGLVIVTFNFNGGNLDNSATIVYELIQHAYKPNSYLIDISHYRNYKLTKSGYVFDGWYTKNGIENDDWGTPWNFQTDRVTQDITLYAKWESEIVFSYTVYLDQVDSEGNLIKLGQYKVKKDDVFNDSRNYGTSLDKYERTFLDYYSDPELETKWDFTTKHPGGEQSLDIPVYVKSMAGVWTFVSTYEELVAAKSKNIWLTANIDCGGKELHLGDYNSTLYGGGFEEDGFAENEGFTISNFTVTNSHNTTNRPQFAIFGELGAKAKIQNVHFADVHFEIQSWANSTEIRVAALAIQADAKCQITNVTVTGDYVIKWASNASDSLKQRTLETLANINSQPFYQANSEVDSTSFEANIQPKQD